jgi:hypothetical protein
MEWYQFLLVFWLGVAVNELFRQISKAIHEDSWECPYCSLKITSDSKDFLFQLKASHTQSHLQ